MSVECYRSKGRNSYYYKEKKVSKKLASSISPKLPKCFSNTKSRADAMNRVTQDLKSQIDRECRVLREKLESTTRSYDEKVEQLIKIVERNKLDIKSYQKELLSVNEEKYELNDNIKKLIDENNVLKQSLINAENTIEKYKNKYADDMVAAEEKIQKLVEDNKMLKNTYNEMLDINDNLDASLAVAIEKSRECFEENKELTENFSNERLQLEGSLFNIQNDNERIKEALEQANSEDRECEADRLVLQEDINILRTTAENLKNKIVEEKNECLERVQRAIEETEGNIGSREARRYEKELSDLNSKLRLTEEALNELKKAGTLEGKKMPAKAVKKAIKKMKQASK